MLEFSKRLLPQIKMVLREAGTEFDDEIGSYIEGCATDLNDAGILLSFFVPVGDDWKPDPNILQAVRWYCLSKYGLYNADMEKYEKAYASLKSTLATQRKYTYGSKILTQKKHVIITENGNTKVLPDVGYVLSEVDITTDVKSDSPLAYHKTSVDELPTDAVEGSLAVVKSDSLIGKWLFGEVLDLGMPNEPIRFSGEFIGYADTNESSEMPVYGTQFDIYIEEGWTCLSIIPPDGFARPIYDTDNDPAWSSDNSRELTILSCDDEQLLHILKSTATRLSGGHTLYSRENGEWVSKGEI